MLSSALSQLERFFRYLETERRVSPHTVSAYRLDLAALVAFCDGQEVSKWQQLTARHIRDFAAQSHKGGLAPASVQRRLSAVRSFCTFLCGQAIAMRGNPAEGVLAPKHRRPLPTVLTVEQMAGLLNIKDPADPLAGRDKAIMELLYSSALRLSELIGADVDSLDLKDRTVRVLGKGNVVRVVPVGRHALAALERWLPVRKQMARRGEAALFVGRNGERLTPRAVQSRVDLWARRQGIQTHVHPHMFRHACATHLLESSGQLREVQEFLGHASIATTQIYTHLDFAHLAATYYAKHPRAGRKLPEALTPQVLARIARSSP